MKASFRGKHGEVCNVTVNVIYGCCNKNCKEQVVETAGIYSPEYSVPDAGAAHPVRNPEQRQNNYSHKPQVVARELKDGVDEIALKAQYEDHLRRPEDFFQMNLRPKGRVLIINNNFRGAEGVRNGSETDVTNLYNTFVHIGACKKDIHENLTSREIMATVKALAHSEQKASFYAIFVMSHGEQDKTTRHDMVVGYDNTLVSTKEVVDVFAVPHLTDTPVLMFFQMCRAVRGEKPKRSGNFERVQRCDQSDALSLVCEQEECETSFYKDLSRDLSNALLDAFPFGQFIEDCDEEGEDVPDARALEKGCCDEGDMPASEHIEKTPNMLVSFSTAEGHVSLRHTAEGSWYIQELCKAFKNHAHDEDLLTLMNRIHIAVKFRRSNAKEYRNWEFVCRTAHSLKKKLSFFPGV